ncbi:MAG: NAD(P)H dehydrogenase (quinone) [Cognaticolwellia sp.]|jgi:NAD(P)H dehydrogenase (quinone)
MSTKPLILVTTANGRTGSAALKELVKLGFPTRALVRRDDARAARWRTIGVDVVLGDLYDHRDLERALVGVKRAYHCTPPDAAHLHGSMLFALAAEQAGVEVIALMSTWNPNAVHPSIVQREHWMANNLYRRLPVDVIHINPGLFAFTYMMGLPAIKHFGMLAGPFGDGLNSPPSNEDIGAVVAHALANPERWINGCLRPMGPERLSPTDVAEIFSRVLERPVKFKDVPETMFVKFALANGFSTFEVAQVRKYFAELRAGAFAQDPNDCVLEVTGRAPESFETTARRYVAEPSLIWPGLRTDSWFAAAGLAVRAMLTRVPDLDGWEEQQSYPIVHNGQLAHESEAWQTAAGTGLLALLPDPRVAS